MGRLLVSAAGLAIGFAFGAPGIGLAIGNILGALLFPQKFPDIVGPRLNELFVNSSAYGQPISIHYGRIRTGTEVTWSTDLIETEHRESVGGKGLGGSQTRISFTYSASWEVFIGEGLIQGVRRIWAGPKLIYDARETNTGPVSQFLSNISFQFGSETQLPHLEVEADQGAANSVADRGIAKIHFKEMPLADFGNTIPAISAEVALRIIELFPSTSWPLPLVTVVAHSFDRSRIYTWSRSFPENSGTVRCWSASDLSLIASNVISLPAGEEFGSQMQVIAESGGLIPTGESMWIAIQSPVDGIVKVDTGSLEIIQRVNVTFSLEMYPGNIQKSDGTLFTTAVYLDRLTDAGYIISPGTMEETKYEEILDYPRTGADAGDVIRGWSNPGIDSGGCAWFFGDPGTAGDPNVYYVMEVGPSGVIRNFTIPQVDDFRVNRTGIIPQFTVQYCHFTNSMFVLLENDTDDFGIMRFSLDTLSVDATILDFFNDPGAHPSFGHTEYTNLFMSQATLWFLLGTAAPNSWELDTVNMVLLREDYSGWPSAGHGEFDFYNEQLHALMFSGKRDLIDRFGDDEFDSTITTVRDVAEDLLERAGYVPADLDITALDDLVNFEAVNPGFHKVHGMSIKSRSAIRDTLERLARTYFFTLVESDWQIVAIDRKGDNPSGTLILTDDMGAYERGQKAPKAVLETIKQEIELPERVDVVYISEARDYQEGSQDAKRISSIVTTQEQVTQRVNISLSSEQAIQIAETLLYQAWIGRTSYEFTLPPAHIRIDPGDYLRIPVEGVNTRVFVETIDYGVSGLLKISTTRDDNEVFVSESIGSDVPFDDNDSLVSFPPPSTLINMDIPLLRDKDEDAGFYQGASGPNGYTGTIVDVSDSGGSNWLGLISYTKAQVSITGFLTAVLSPGPTTLFDETNTFTVRFFNDTFALSSVTETEILTDKTISGHINGEVIKWQTVVDNGDGTWTLSKLLRGLRGTENSMVTHALGSRFTVLTPSTTARISAESSEIGVERLYRATSINAVTLALFSIAFTNTAKGLFPYSPVYITATKDGTGRTINWFRRARTDHELRDNVDVPLGEATEDYEVDIVNKFGVVVRTITTTASANGSVVTPATQTAFYAIEDERFDVGLAGVDHSISVPSGLIDIETQSPKVVVSAEDTFDITVPTGQINVTTDAPAVVGETPGLLVRVYQLSAVVGRGFPGEARI